MGHEKLLGAFRAVALLTCLLIQAGVLCAVPNTRAPVDENRYAGKPLSEVLLDLRSRGLKIVFTTEVVRPEMLVETEPRATEPREILEEVLGQHGLMTSEGPRGTIVVVPRPGETVEPPPDESPPVVVLEEEVVVTPSRVSLLRDEPGAIIGLTREEILSLPHLGDDFFRAVSLLPGIAANDVSAQFYTRGARRDATQIVLDGQELYEAHHLKDFDSALSFVTSSTLESADLTTGGFSAEFGDRMAGILEMTTVNPSGRPRGRVGVSILNLLAGGAGGFHDNRGNWLVEVRRGTTDLLARLFGNEDPKYADAYAKTEYRLDDRNSLRFNMLLTDDQFDFVRVDGPDSTDTSNNYRNAYYWLTHSVVIGDRMLLETALSLSTLDQDRRGIELEEDVQFTVRDERQTEVSALRQFWNFQVARRNFLKWGFELRRYDTVYDYSSTFNFENPIAGLRPGPVQGMTVFEDEFEENHTSIYLADQMRLGERVTLELGLRHDRYTLTDESLFNPRFNLAWAVDNTSVFRVAWGRFSQSQRTYELQVEDGEDMFNPTERSEHRIIGYERIFRRGPETRRLAMRAEIYQREVENPRPRFENLWEAFNVFPELEPDRIRIDPDRSRAEGFELFFQGQAGRRLAWWVNYAYATTEDELSGEIVKRSVDQTHALSLDCNYGLGEHWNLNFAWRYHTGWPTTPVTLEETVDGGGNTIYVPVLGPLNSKRLTDYHRLDLRASRVFKVGVRGTLTFFVDVQNVYDRKNLAGFDISIDSEEGTIEINNEYWAGILPSVGLIYEF